MLTKITDITLMKTRALVVVVSGIFYTSFKRVEKMEILIFMFNLGKERLSRDDDRTLGGCRAHRQPTLI
jgi:hypothetical protein